jgi:four helix bundle protein
MRAERFEDLIVWQKSKEMTLTLYMTLKELKDFAFRDQICRASVSIMNNIAEGFERGTDKEFKYFLYIAKGSSGEVRSMLHIALDLKYINEKKYQELSLISNEISKMLSGLIKSIT